MLSIKNEISTLAMRWLKVQKDTIKVMNGGEKTLLSVVRLCRMGVPSKRALDISKNRHLTIGYLLMMNKRI